VYIKMDGEVNVSSSTWETECSQGQAEAITHDASIPGFSRPRGLCFLCLESRGTCFSLTWLKRYRAFLGVGESRRQQYRQSVPYQTFPAPHNPPASPRLEYSMWQRTVPKGSDALTGASDQTFHMPLWGFGEIHLVVA